MPTLVNVRQRGQGMVEYSLILALMVLGVAVGLAVFMDNLNSFMEVAPRMLDSV